MYGQSVYFMWHQIANLIIHQPMPGHGGFATERFGCDVDAIVSCAAPGTGMTSMQVGFILNV